MGAVVRQTLCQQFMLEPLLSGPASRQRQSATVCVGLGEGDLGTDEHTRVLGAAFTGMNGCRLNEIKADKEM